MNLARQACTAIVSLNDKACNAVRSESTGRRNAWENIQTTVRQLVPIRATRVPITGVAFRSPSLSLASTSIFSSEAADVESNRVLLIVSIFQGGFFFLPVIQSFVTHAMMRGKKEPFGRGSAEGALIHSEQREPSFVTANDGAAGWP